MENYGAAGVKKTMVLVLGKIKGKEEIKCVRQGDSVSKNVEKHQKR
jgi:hypothetical protein